MADQFAIRPPSLDTALLQQALDAAPAVMVVVGLPGRQILYANRAARAAAVGGPDDLVGRPVGAPFPFVEPTLLAAPPRPGSPPSRVAVDGAGGAMTWWDVSCTALDTAGTPAVLVTAVDVTAQEIAQAEAEAARDTLDALLAYVPEGITFSYGTDVRITRVSAQGAALAGRDPAELTGHSALKEPDTWQVYRPGASEPMPPEERPMAHATRTGAVTMNETLLIRRPDGTMLPVLCNAGPIRDTTGRITGAVMAWRDIGALWLAQSAQRRSEERLRAVLLQLPAAVFIVEAPDGRVTFKSQRVDEVLGHPDPDLEAARTGLQGWAVHPDGTPYDIGEYPSRRALFQGETVQAEPMTYWRGDHRLIDLEVYAGPVRDETGTVVAAVVAVLDVTDRNHAAQQLRESEERLRVALQVGGLGTWEVDPVTNTNRLGRSLAEMLGLPAEPVSLDRSASAAFIHPEDRERVAAEFSQALAKGSDYSSEFRVCPRDGSTRWFVTHGRILRAPDGSPQRAVGVIRDVTDRRTREDRLRDALEARELLLREADHRIKNSLQLVGSLLGLQRSRLSDPDAVAALDGAISRVMAVSEAHRALHQSIDLRHVALDEMLRDLCTHAAALNPALHFVADCPAELELDTERAIPLGLAVSELLTNAAKHAYPSGAGEVRTTVTATDGMFEIAVADTGVGMTEAAPSRGQLGSTIVRALAAQIGAELAVVSAAGAGTRTTLRFAGQP